MRQYFVPACICLMTLSGATGSDPIPSLENFTGVAKSDNKVVAQAAPAAVTGSTEPAHVDIPIDMTAADVALEAPALDLQMKTTEPQPVPLPPIAKPVVRRSRQEICDTLAQSAQTNDLPIPFFISLLFQESRFKPSVVSSAGAQGIAQFMPETAADMGLENPFDPLQAIPASARLLRNLIHQFGNLGLAAAAYNAGPRRIQNWLEKKGKLPQETQGYVKTITGRPAENWTAAKAVHPGQRVPRRAPCQEAAGLYAWTGPKTIPLPSSSPLAHRVAPSASNRPAIAALHPEKATRHALRMTAVIKMAKSANSSAPRGPKTGSQQLAARQHKVGKQKLEKVAQR